MLALAVATVTATNDEVTLTLTTDTLPMPLGVSGRPRFSWRLAAEPKPLPPPSPPKPQWPPRASSQAGYHLQVARSAAALAEGRYLWEHTAETNSSSLVKYGATTALAGGGTYLWRVWPRYTFPEGNNGTWGLAWSAPATFSVAPTAFAGAEFIGLPISVQAQPPPPTVCESNCDMVPVPNGIVAASTVVLDRFLHIPQPHTTHQHTVCRALLGGMLVGCWCLQSDIVTHYQFMSSSGFYTGSVKANTPEIASIPECQAACLKDADCVQITCDPAHDGQVRAVHCGLADVHAVRREGLGQVRGRLKKR